MATATVGRSLISQTALLAGGGPVTSVLICDDRPGVIPGLTEMLRPLPALTALDWVPDGFALLDAVTTSMVDVVLIGIHHGSGTGVEAVTLLLSMHPSMVIVVFGAAADIGPLAAAFTRGARALLLWPGDDD